MPGSDVPDYRTPSPDDGHEAIREPLERAIDELAQTVEDLGYTTDDAGLSLDMADTLFVLIDSLMATNNALTERVAALEAAATPPTDPPPEVAP
jgi:hypothetical protein